MCLCHRHFLCPTPLREVRKGTPRKIRSLFFNSAIRGSETRTRGYVPRWKVSELLPHARPTLYEPVALLRPFDLLPDQFLKRGPTFSKRREVVARTPAFGSPRRFRVFWRSKRFDACASSGHVYGGTRQAAFRSRADGRLFGRRTQRSGRAASAVGQLSAPSAPHGNTPFISVSSHQARSRGERFGLLVE